MGRFRSKKTFKLALHLRGERLGPMPAWKREAVVISIWNVDPFLSRGAVRLANVEMIERARHQQTQPRVRMLVLNPNASAPLSESHDALIRQTL